MPSQQPRDISVLKSRANEDALRKQLLQPCKAV
jgi:hypothetical protein